MSSSAEATLPSRASSRLEVIVGAAILNFDITSGDCVERKLGSLGAIAGRLRTGAGTFGLRMVGRRPAKRTGALPPA